MNYHGNHPGGNGRSNEDFDPNSMTLTDFFDSMYRPLRLTGASLNSVRLHQCSMSNLQRFLERVPTLIDLTDDTVARFMAWHIAKGNSPYTANNERNRLLAQWRFACRKRLIEIWPDVQLLPEPKRTPKAWTVEEINQILAACQSQLGRVSGVLARFWWIAIHLFIWETGERIGAVLQVRWDDVDFDSGWVNIRAESRKGCREDKSHLLGKATLAALRRIRSPKRSLIFPWRQCRSNLYYRYDKILRAAGLPTDRKSKFHRMRKSTASHFKAAGGDAMELLGHSDGRVTKTYLDPRIVGVQQAVEILPTISDCIASAHAGSDKTDTP